MNKSLRYTLLRDLNEIKRKLDSCENEKFRNTLINDIKYIDYYLGRDELNIKRINNQNKLEIADIVTTNKIEHINLKTVRSNKNEKKVNNNEIFNNFVDENEFGLKSTYYSILNYNGIYYDKTKKEYLGQNIYIKSLDKNYIEIYKTDKLMFYEVLIHELGHAHLNFLNQNSFDKNLSSNFSETYSYFLGLKFMDYIKNYNLYRQSFNYKHKFFMNIVLDNEVLNDKIYTYLKSTDVEFNALFDYDYKLFLSKLLALYFYNLYSTNKNDALQKLKMFSNNFGNSNDVQLLKFLNIKIDDLKNKKILYNFYEGLIKERSYIKIKRKQLI